MFLVLRVPGLIPAAGLCTSLHWDSRDLALPLACWASCFPALCLSFPLCQMKMMRPLERRFESD